MAVPTVRPQRFFENFAILGVAKMAVEVIMFDNAGKLRV